MENSYQEPGTAIKYLDFLNSSNGQIQQQILSGAILSHLPKNPNTAILDAGCGPGWLAAALKQKFNNVKACDASEFFIQFAKAHHSGIEFKRADVTSPLPYPNACFDAVVLNMVGPDLNNLPSAFKNISAVLKPHGKLLMTIPNPKLTYPAAEWKRNLIQLLLLQKPKLKLKTPPVDGEKIKREFNKNSKIDSYYHSLGSYVQSASGAGFKLKQNLAITSKTDSPEFDLNYQLLRYPLLLLLEFEKIG